MPVAQFEHVRFVLVDPELSTYVPRPQVARAVHAVALVELLKFVPTVQAVQVRSFEAEPITLMYWPVVQVRQGVQVVDEPLVLNVPGAQFVQMLLVVAVPGVVNVLPAGQALQL